MTTPFANILHRETIRRLTTDRAFVRGQVYFEQGRIRDLTHKDGTVRASVRGSSEYVVQLWAHDESLAYSCSCPQGQDKAFCKHAVALGLAWLARSQPNAPEAESVALRLVTKDVSAPSREPELRGALDRMTRSAIVELVCELAKSDPKVIERVLAAAPPRKK